MAGAPALVPQPAAFGAAGKAHGQQTEAKNRDEALMHSQSLQVTALKEAAPSLGVTLLIQDIRTGDDLPAAFDAGVRARVDGVLTTAESLFIVHRARVSELAARHKLPAIYPYSIQCESIQASKRN
jgi:hypothetical protein